MPRSSIPAVFIGQPPSSSFHIDPIFPRLPAGLPGGAGSGGYQTLMYPSDSGTGGGGYQTLVAPSDNSIAR